MKTPSSGSGITRRKFIAATGLAVAAPTIIPASVLGGEGQPAPSNRITMGVVGWGWQGSSDAENFLGMQDVQVVAISDIDRNHLKDGLDVVNKRYQNQDCKGYHDFREMMARKDIDAILAAVPDHWHALVAVEAAKNGKDIYGEKPLARTIAEQQAIVKAVQTGKRIWQTGSWQRSERNFHYAAEIVRNGLIGRITRVEVGLPGGHTDFAKTAGPLLEKLAQLPDKPDSLAKVVPGTPAWDAAVSQPPADLDFETWIGPSKMEPYIEARIHKNWRWNYNTGGGQLLDWIGHHCDIAHWGLGNDDTIGPIEVEGNGQFPPKDAIWNTSPRYRVTAKYPGEITMIISDDSSDIRGGTKWIGTDGWVWVNRNNAFESSNKDYEDARSLKDDQRKIKLPLTRGDAPHYRNFIESVKTRQPTVAPAEVAHHSAIPGHLGLIAMLVGRKIKWDPAKEMIIGDEEAAKLLSRPYRGPFRLG